MSTVEAILRDEISRNGPVTFHHFMRTALYHPGSGYYVRRDDPFGREGDFYTAEQIQPVFGILIASRIRSLYEEMGRPSGFVVVELGAGRGEMASALQEFRYFPVDAGSGEWPKSFTGVVFSNEFFDALPVHLAVCRGGTFREVRVDWRNGRFVWADGENVAGPVKDYLDHHAWPAGEGNLVEVPLDALEWIDRIASRLERGYVFTIDYGYTVRESIRFPQGTLMSYRRHTARDDVLAEPGERDITAHVCFTALEERGKARGLETVCFEPLARTLLAAGEPDQFSSALAAASPEEQLRRRLQLKTLLYGMGETFRTLLQRKKGKN